jgi:hypothetical protein
MKHSNYKVIKHTYRIITLLALIIMGESMGESMDESMDERMDDESMDDESIINNAYITTQEEVIILELDGDTLIDDPAITSIISVDSSNKLKYNGITNWFQLIGLVMTFRIKNLNTNLMISDKQWFNNVCKYFNKFDIINSEQIAYSIISYLTTRIAIPL